MDRHRAWSLRAIDVAGTLLVTVGLLGFLWLTVVRGDDANTEIQELTRTLVEAARNVATLRATRDQQQAVLEERRAELAAGGQLPLQTPIEEYFQTLSRLASDHRLRVVRHHPLTPRSYPGMLEQRYAYEVSGAIPDIARFFKAVEDDDFWADISYLKIAGGDVPLGAATPDERTALLTISVFFALPTEAAPDHG